MIWVAPCWPAILRPLNTRAASVEPIDPACLMLCDPCDTGPRWKLWRLCCPENPLPWLTPVTSIRCPAVNMSTLSRVPTATSPASRNSFSRTWGWSPARLKWPRIGLEVRFTAFSPNPSCTAS